MSRRTGIHKTNAGNLPNSPIRSLGQVLHEQHLWEHIPEQKQKREKQEEKKILLNHAPDNTATAFTETILLSGTEPKLKFLRKHSRTQPSCINTTMNCRTNYHLLQIQLNRHNEAEHIRITAEFPSTFSSQHSVISYLAHNTERNSKYNPKTEPKNIGGKYSDHNNLMKLCPNIQASTGRLQVMQQQLHSRTLNLIGTDDKPTKH